jgi:beta-galactosidase
MKRSIEGSTRRRFLAGTSAAVATGAAMSAAPAQPAAAEAVIVSLNGTWQFRLDRDSDWRDVQAPHTWQIEPANAEYMGVGWYKRVFDVPAEWQSSVVRIEFEAVFHTAVVTINGREAGIHSHKGHTAFAFDITRLRTYTNCVRHSGRTASEPHSASVK